MRKVIWKYALEPAPEQKITMPINARVLDVQMQRSEAVIWAEVEVPEGDVSEPSDREQRLITIVATGQTVPDFVGDYVGTFQSLTGLVFHVYA